jgi:hypothetical protein
MAGCKKDNEEETESRILYQEFAVNHSVITNDTLYYDLDADSAADIVVTKHLDTVNGKIHYAGTISGLNGNVRLTYMKISPGYEMLDTNDIITNSAAFQWLETIRYEGGIDYIEGNTSWPYGVFTKYFGICVGPATGDCHLGWFDLEFFVIRELGYNLVSNSSIRVGQKK